MKNNTRQIRERFDNDVERFSDGQTGQVSTMDSALSLSLFETCLPALNPDAKTLCDIGCGGGNFSVRLSRKMPKLQTTLVDLSANMLQKAADRLSEGGHTVKETIQGDIREIQLPANSFDVIVAAAVLHHLRTEKEWQSVLNNIYRALTPGGVFWIWDLIRYDDPQIQEIQTHRYADYLIQTGGETYQKHIFDFIDKEDTPQSTPFILRTLTSCGFGPVEIVHKNAVYCALYGRKATQKVCLSEGVFH